MEVSFSRFKIRDSWGRIIREGRYHSPGYWRGSRGPPRLSCPTHPDHTRARVCAAAEAYRNNNISSGSPTSTNGPQEKFAVLRHAAACRSMLQAMGRGGGGGATQIFQKLQKWQTPDPNAKECISRHPAKMNTTESLHGWSWCLLQLPTANSLSYSWLSPYSSWVVLSPLQWVQQ